MFSVLIAYLIPIDGVVSFVTAAKSYRQQSAVYMQQAVASGEDVVIYARGPMSHLFTGTLEQNDIAHLMAYASCVGEYTTDCPESRWWTDGCTNTTNTAFFLFNKLKFDSLTSFMFVCLFNSCYKHQVKETQLRTKERTNKDKLNMQSNVVSQSMCLPK